MPDVKEVFEMVAQQTGPQQGALERQFKKHDRKNRNRKIGAFALAAAIGVAAIVVILANRPGQDSTTPVHEGPTVYPVDPQAMEVATGFVQSFGAFDGEQAVTYLADNAYLQMDATTPGMVPVFTSLLEAMGYEQILDDPCRVTGTSAAGTALRCPFDWHAIRSDELGLGPYPGNWELSVRDGEIVSAALHWKTRDFSPQMWEPFRDWVRDNHPKDFDVMYIDDGGNFRLTDESTRLWEERTKEYVKAVQHGAAP